MSQLDVILFSHFHVDHSGDFALSLGEFYCSQLTEPVLVEVQREGVVYARVYDIRGRAVTRLSMPQ